MAYLPPAQLNGLKEPSGAKKPSVGFLSFVKNIIRALKRTKKAAVTLRVKRDIGKLEHERSKEHADLLRQRNFYERLLRRGGGLRVNSTLEKIFNKPVETKESRIDKIVASSELKKSVIEKIPEPPKPVDIESALLEAPAYQGPSSQDIYPLKKIQLPEIKKEEPIVPVVPVAPAQIKESIAEPLVKATKEVKEEKKLAIVSSENKIIKKIKSLFIFGSLAKKLAQERQEEEAAKSKTDVEGRFWQPYDGVKANLVKDQAVSFFNWQQKMLTLALSLILCCLAISLVYVGLLIWQKEKLNDNKATLANFDAINAEVVKNEDDLKEITNFNKKLDMVQFLLNNHIYWTNFFNFLENNTLKDIYYEKFTGDLTGKYKIPSVARNLDAISLQLEVMKAYNMIKTIQYSSAQSDNTNKDVAATVKFNLELSIDPKIFIK